MNGPGRGVPNAILLQKPFSLRQLVIAVSRLLTKGTGLCLGAKQQLRAIALRSSRRSHAEAAQRGRSAGRIVAFGSIERVPSPDAVVRRVHP
jgi:hypothetical protein